MRWSGTRAWVGWIFPARDPEDLAALRISVSMVMLMVVSARTAAHFSVYPAELCFPPGYFARWIGRIEVQAWWVWAVYAAFVPSAAMAMVGWRSRTSALVMLLTGAMLLSVPQFFGKIVHYNHLVWFAMLLPISPCGDAWSVDAWMSRRAARLRGEPIAAIPAHVAYGVPLRCVVVLLGVIYFFPGLRKVTEIGPEWASAESIINFLHIKWREFDTGMDRWWWQGADAGYAAAWVRVDRVPWLCAAIGWFTIVFELGFLPMALWRRTRPLVLIAGLGFHAGIYATMGITIGHVVVGYVALARWRRVKAMLMRSRATDAAMADVAAGALGRVYWPWPAMVVGAMLIAGNIHNGLLRRNDWPLGEYPTFAFKSGPRMAHLEVIATMPDGRERVLSERMLGRYTESSRARGLAGILLADARPSRRRLMALWEVWKRLDPTLAEAVRVRFERVEIDVHPEAARAAIDRRVLHQQRCEAAIVGVNDAK
jgi:hypothetical protein